MKETLLKLALQKTTWAGASAVAAEILDSDGARMLPERYERIYKTYLEKQ